MKESESIEEQNKLYIRFLVVIVGQACNLRCRDCGNFAPFAPKETLRYDVNRIIGHLKIITKYARIRLLQIQGGEPFIYPRLETLLEFVRHCPEIEKCLIATNGTVLPNVSPAILRHEKFIVRISQYPVASNISRKVQKWLHDNSIRYEMYHFVSKEDKWFDLGKGKTYKPGAEAEARFQNCLFRNCLTLEDGFLGRCSRSVIAWKLQGFAPRRPNRGGGCYLPVSDSETFRVWLDEYISNPRHMEACCYCNGTDVRLSIEPAIQLKSGEKWEDF